LYKYTTREYAHRLKNMGTLRVGTLHDYQNAAHKPGIVDAFEGTKTLTHTATKPLDIVVGQHGETKILDDFGFKYESGATFRAYGENVKIIRNQSTPNCFIYCVSDVLSKTVMSEFEGADSCIEIADMQWFIEELTDILNSVHPVAFVEFNSVEYTSRKSVWHPEYENMHPAWIKDPSYSKQREWRLMWNSLIGGPISPVIIGGKALTSLVRLIKA